MLKEKEVTKWKTHYANSYGKFKNMLNHTILLQNI